MLVGFLALGVRSEAPGLRRQVKPRVLKAPFYRGTGVGSHRCWRQQDTVFSRPLSPGAERAHLCNAAIDLDTHIEDVVSVLQYEDLHEVVLVGHSYGGMVITGAAERAAERLAHLCYLDAFVPEDGQALADLVGPAIIADAPGKAQLSTDGSRVPMPFPPAAVGIEKDADVVWMTPRLTPHPLNSLL